MDNSKILINFSKIDEIGEKFYTRIFSYITDIIELSFHYEVIHIIVSNLIIKNILSNYFLYKHNILFINDNLTDTYNEHNILNIDKIYDNNENIYNYLNIMKKNDLYLIKDESILVQKMIEMIQSNGFNISNNSFERSMALGIGDILFNFVLLNNNIIEFININIATFLIYKNSINYLDFRIKLIVDLCKYNNISFSKILFYFDIENDRYLAKENDKLYKLIKNYKLNLFDTESNISNINTKKYINFHTKSRFFIDKNLYEKNIKIYSNLLSHLKISDIYNINILGEKYLPNNNSEINLTTALITSIYPYLMNLSNNNNVNDLTSNIIIDNLDYNMFLDDIKIIQNAEYNITFGGGGPFCFSMIFAKNNVISLCKEHNMVILKNQILKINNIFNFCEINSFIKFIENKLSSNKIIIDTIKPTLGLGDLLALKQKTIQYNMLIKNIIIDIGLLKYYKPNTYEKALIIISDRLKLLFNDTTIIYTENDDNKFSLLPEYSFNKFINIYDYLNINNYNLNNITDYIIFHTKIRFCNDYMNNHFNKYIINIIRNFLLNFKTEKTIVIFGERIIETNLESTALNIISIYDELLLLKNNNNVLDLTHDILYTGQDNINSFIEEVNIMYEANCNICFSIGGHFCLSFSFSNKLISFFPTEFLKCISKDDMNYNDTISILSNNTDSLFKTIYQFINKIDDDYSIVPRNYLKVHRINKNAYFVGHNGLGDNITNSSAIRYLSNFYNKIYFICKDFYYGNVSLLFNDIENIEFVLIDPSDEYNNIKKIYDEVINEYDFFVSGFCHTHYIKSKITNDYLINYKRIEDEIYHNYFNHIKQFYEDINLDLSIYYDFFNIKSSDKSKYLYNSINKYKICLMQQYSSIGKILNIEDFVHLTDDYIIIDINENFYEKTKDINLIKYELAQQFINIEIVYYIDTILNCDKIYISDSSLSCIVYPLFQMNKLNTKDINIIDRNSLKNIISNL